MEDKLMELRNVYLIKNLKYKGNLLTERSLKWKWLNYNYGWTWNRFNASILIKYRQCLKNFRKN